MPKRKGADLLIYVLVSSTPTAIAHSTENSLSVNGETIDVTTKDSLGWRELLAGNKNWSMSGGGAFADDAAYGFSDLLAAMSIDEKLLVRMSFEESGLPYWEGSAYLTKLDLAAPMADKVAFTYTLEGDGELEEIPS